MSRARRPVGDAPLTRAGQLQRLAGGLGVLSPALLRPLAGPPRRQGGVELDLHTRVLAALKRRAHLPPLGRLPLQVVRRANDLLVTAGFDMLRDEGRRYAEALRRAGVTVHYRELRRQAHTLVNIAGFSPGAGRALVEVARRSGELLRGTA